MKFSLPPPDEQRVTDLQRFAVLESPPEKAFDDITELAARFFNVPIASVTLIDEERHWFKSCFGLETREVGRNFVFCAKAILGEGVMIVPDSLLDERFRDDPLVTGAPHIRFYAGAPLRTSDGLNLGTLCLIDTAPRQLDARQISTLESLAKMVVAEIQLRYEIGERRRAHESLRLLHAAVQQSNESVMITTANLDLPGPEIVFVNPAFTEVTGYTAEEVIGQTPRILQGPGTLRASLDEVRRNLIGGEPSHGEAVNYRKDGTQFVLSWRIAPIRAESGEVTHFIGFQRDATESHRSAALLLQAKEEAERANRAKSEFLSRMSHELRTPLNAILGFAQLLETESQSLGDAECVTQISRAGKHLLGLINEVLDIARVEAGQLALTPEPVNVRQTLEEVLALIMPLAAERRVRLVPLEGDYGDILSSAQRFKQVMINLLSNAVKYNRDGGSVLLSCQRIEDCLRIEVADTGHGISPENIAKLFVPFERLGIADSMAEGSGLGLSLSKHLIEAMGGRIGVESILGDGATFWVELPVVERTSAAAARYLAAPLSMAEEKPRVTLPRTVLYIEDNLSNLRLVERIIARRSEVKFISAMQGSIGLELARLHLPDLILLDFHLPDMEGGEILRRLRADPQTAHLPVVIASADATAGQSERFLAAGATAYLTKPIDVRELLAVIDATESQQTLLTPLRSE